MAVTLILLVNSDVVSVELITRQYEKQTTYKSNNSSHDKMFDQFLDHSLTLLLPTISHRLISDG